MERLHPESAVTTTDQISGSDQEYRLRLMLDLPATPVLLAEYEQVQSSGVLIDGKSGDVAGRALDAARFRWELGTERDQIIAMRPFGCWCLGLGGRYPTFLHIPHVHDDGFDEEPIMQEYCSVCPEGTASQEYVRGLRQLIWSRWVERRIIHLFEDAQIEEYRDARLDRVVPDPRNQAAFALALQWVHREQQKSFLIAGPVGSGKTWLMVALIQEWIKTYEGSVWFVTLADLLDQIRDTYDDGSTVRTAEVMARAKRVKLLGLDGIGDTTPSMSEHDRGKLLEILNARAAARLQMIATTNLTSVRPILADGRRGPSPIELFLGERALSRLVGMCGGSVAAGGFIAEWQGEDRRMKGWVA